MNKFYIDNFFPFVVKFEEQLLSVDFFLNYVVNSNSFSEV